MGSTYFNGLTGKYTLKGENWDDSVNYLHLLSKYATKNQVSIKNSLIVHKFTDTPRTKDFPIAAAVQDCCNLEYFKVIMEICEKVNAAPSKEDFEATFKLSNQFSKLSKECQLYIKQMSIKYYPQTEKSKE